MDDLEKTLFALATWSNIGTAWLAGALNLHPQIQTWVHAQAQLGNGRNLPPLEYAERMTLAAWPTKLVCGDIHGLGRPHFGELEQRYGEAFRGGNLLGHPVPLFAAAVAMYRQSGIVWSHDTFLGNRGERRGGALSETVLAVLGEGGNHILAQMMMNIDAVAESLRPTSGTVRPNFRLELLMRSQAEWDRLIAHVSRGQITDFGSRWEQRKGVPTVGDPFQALAEPAASWRALPSDAQRLFAAMLTDEARQTYRDLGYDLSFIPAGPSARGGQSPARTPTGAARTTPTAARRGSREPARR